MLPWFPKREATHGTRYYVRPCFGDPGRDILLLTECPNISNGRACRGVSCAQTALPPLYNSFQFSDHHAPIPFRQSMLCVCDTPRGSPRDVHAPPGSRRRKGGRCLCPFGARLLPCTVAVRRSVVVVSLPPAFPPRRLPLLSPEQDPPDHAGGHGDAADDGDAHQPLPGHAVVDEPAQVRRLEVGRLLVQQQVVVSSGVGVVAELVVPQRQVVQALAAALRRYPEDLRQQADAQLLVAARGRLDEALFRWMWFAASFPRGSMVSGGRGPGSRRQRRRGGIPMSS